MVASGRFAAPPILSLAVVGLFVAFIAVLAVGGTVAFRSFENAHRLKLLPSDLQVSQVIYAKQKTWGFGPGGNETSVYVYALPDAVAARVSREGLLFLSSLSDVVRDGDRWRNYELWRSTPVVATDDRRSLQSARISDYLDQYGFGIPIDPAVERSIDHALANPGAYYGAGRVGLIIVIPRQKRVVFVHAG